MSKIIRIIILAKPRGEILEMSEFKVRRRKDGRFDANTQDFIDGALAAVEADRHVEIESGEEVER